MAVKDDVRTLAAASTLVEDLVGAGVGAAVVAEVSIQLTLGMLVSRCSYLGR
jgi:hypothetical protein